MPLPKPLPKPLTPVRRGSYIPPAISIPLSFPEGWLWEKTVGPLREAVKGLNEAQLETACEKVVLKLKSISLEAVKAGQISAEHGAVRMRELLQTLLEHNRRWDAGGYEILKRLRQTETWIKFEGELTGEQTLARTQTEAEVVKDAVPIGETDVNQADKAQRERERGPSREMHWERTAFEDELRKELAAIQHRIEKEPDSSVGALRERFPEYRLWTILSATEQEELLTIEFKPRAYARILTARKFSVGAEAIKKSRQKGRR